MPNLDFLNLNSIRNYPIKDGLDCTSVDGFFTIPADLIVDISIAATGSITDTLFVSSINNTSSYIIVEISTSAGNIVGTFYIPANTANYTDIPLTPSLALPNSVGMLTVGTLATIVQQPTGIFTFTVDDTALLSRVYCPITTGINYLTFVDSNNNSVSLTNNVTIQAESNLRFRYLNNIIYLDAGEGLGLNSACDNSATPVKTINGITPDSNGNFTIIPENCVSIDTAEYGLVLNDTCGQPCQGCSTVSTLTDRVISVESNLLTLRDYVTSLNSAITQLTTLINYQGSNCN